MGLTLLALRMSTGEFKRQAVYLENPQKICGKNQKAEPQFGKKMADPRKWKFWESPFRTSKGDPAPGSELSIWVPTIQTGDRWPKPKPTTSVDPKATIQNKRKVGNSYLLKEQRSKSKEILEINVDDIFRHPEGDALYIDVAVFRAQQSAPVREMLYPDPEDRLYDIKDHPYLHANPHPDRYKKLTTDFASNIKPDLTIEEIEPYIHNWMVRLVDKHRLHEGYDYSPSFTRAFGELKEELALYYHKIYSYQDRSDRILKQGRTRILIPGIPIGGGDRDQPLSLIHI